MAGHQAGIDPGPHLLEDFVLIIAPALLPFVQYVSWALRLNFTVYIDKTIYIFSKFQYLSSYWIFDNSFICSCTYNKNTLVNPLQYIVLRIKPGFF